MKLIALENGKAGDIIKVKFNFNKQTLSEKIMKEKGDTFIDKVESFINKDKIRMLKRICKNCEMIKRCKINPICQVYIELTKLGGGK